MGVQEIKKSVVQVSQEEDKISPKQEALREVLDEIKRDAQIDAPRYAEDARVPNGGE